MGEIFSTAIIYLFISFFVMIKKNSGTSRKNNNFLIKVFYIFVLFSTNYFINLFICVFTFAPCKKNLCFPSPSFSLLFEKKNLTVSSWEFPLNFMWVSNFSLLQNTNVTLNSHLRGLSLFDEALRQFPIF